MNIEGPGFSADIDVPPDEVLKSTGIGGHTNFVFADFAFRHSGKASIHVDGVQIGLCMSPNGITVGDDTHRLRLGRYAIIFRPPGSGSRSTWEQAFHGRFLFFSPAAIERFFHLSMNRIAFGSADCNGATGVVSHLYEAFTHDLAAGNPSGPMFMESLSAAVLRLFATPVQAERQPRGLSDAQARLLRAMIVERSAEPLSLATLADAVGLSVGHMLRSFKQTFGLTPHQYLINERVEAATSLLRADARKGLDEIALETGFGTRAQMARTFRAVLGKLPRDVR